MNEQIDSPGISLLLLLAIADKILTAYADRGFKSVDLNTRQYYHAVAADEMFDMSKVPRELIVGDLYDDIAELKRLIGDDLPTAVDIERLGRLLIAISESVVD